MKLWDSLITCLILLSAVHASRLLRSRPQSSSTERRGRAADSPLELPPIHGRLSLASPEMSLAEAGTVDWERTLAEGEKSKSVWLYGVPKVPKNTIRLASSRHARS